MASSTDRTLTIAPITAWRRWVVSQRRPWEKGAGAVLRGAWGRAWTEKRLTARCLRPPVNPAAASFGEYLATIERRLHATTPPEPKCTCGVYAEKVDAVTPTLIPLLEGHPAIGGFVELSGIVIEGSRGYRAGEAVIVGPLELHVPCVGAAVNGPQRCPNPVRVIQSQGCDPFGACEDHVRTTGGVLDIVVSDWVRMIAAQLEAIYATEIIHAERRAVHGHR